MTRNIRYADVDANCEFLWIDARLVVQTIKPIEAHEELTLNRNQVPKMISVNVYSKCISNW